MENIFVCLKMSYIFFVVVDTFKSVLSSELPLFPTHPTSLLPSLPLLSPPSGSQSKRRWRGGCHHEVALSPREHWASCNIIPPGCDQGQGNRDGRGSAAGGGRAWTMWRIVCLHFFSPFCFSTDFFCNMIWGQTIITTSRWWSLNMHNILQPWQNSRVTRCILILEL